MMKVLKFPSFLPFEIGEGVGDLSPPLDQLGELLSRIHQVAAAASAACPAGSTPGTSATRRLGGHANGLWTCKLAKMTLSLSGVNFHKICIFLFSVPQLEAKTLPGLRI